MNFILSVESCYSDIGEVSIWFIYKEKESNFLHLYVQTSIHYFILSMHAPTSHLSIHPFAHLSMYPASYWSNEYLLSTYTERVSVKKYTAAAVDSL